MLFSLLIIGIIHLYSLLSQQHFTSAEPVKVIMTSLTNGFPFGASWWAFKNLLFEKKQL